jgi:hypothetical protein
MNYPLDQASTAKWQIRNSHKKSQDSIIYTKSTETKILYPNTVQCSQVFIGAKDLEVNISFSVPAKVDLLEYLNCGRYGLVYKPNEKYRMARVQLIYTKHNICYKCIVCSYL